MYIDPKSDKWLNAVKRYPCLAQYSEPVKKMNRELIGRDQQMRTLLATFERVELSNALLLASPGSGKALDNNTPIPVDDSRGYVRIGDIKAGDITFDEKGLPTRVIGVYPKGYCDSFEVIFEHGERIVCNDEHLWEVCERYSDGTYSEFETLSLAKIMSKGILDGSGRPRLCVPVSRAVKRSMPEDYNADISRYIRRNVVFLPIPDEWLMLSVPDKTTLINDLREATFGSLVTGEGGIVCSEPDVAYSVAALATSNGMRADIEYQESRILVHCSYVREPEAIVSVRRLPEQCQMTCIRVDSPNSLFICGSCHVVTHNTALVQGTMVADDKRIYLEINLSRMIADLNNVDELGDRLKTLFAEASDFSSRSTKSLVLFMDEFHQIVQLSPAAVEALKPLLADSATRGVRVIAATTNREFSEFVEGNQPLVERFSQIRLHEPNKEVVVSILKDMAERYGVANKIVGNALYELIYDVTNRHMTSEAQPRKSIMMLDAMVGWHKFAKRKMNKNLLADVMYEQRNINIAFSVDAAKIRKELDAHVFAQQYATRAVEQRLQLSVAGLGNPTKPQGSFLLCGSTGTGKALSNSTPVPAVSPVDGSLIYINHGDLKVGDVVFDRQGKPTKVLATFKHHDKPMYKITFSDGRTIEAADDHLWAVYTSKLRQKVHEGKSRDPYIMTTQEIFDKGVVRESDDSGRKHMKWFIPMNEAVETSPVDYVVDPYVVGAFIANGCLTDDTLTYSGNDVEVVDKISEKIHALGYRVNPEGNYNWQFLYDDATAAYFGSRWLDTQKYATRFVKTRTLFCDMPELMGVKSVDRRIPKVYMSGSIEQRWALVRGLFDTDGSVTDDDRVRISYSTGSAGLAEDVVQLLYSLGISSTINKWYRSRENDKGEVVKSVEYNVRVKASPEDKIKFFSLSRKRDVAAKAVVIAQSRKRVKKFDMVGIKSIEPIGIQDAQCIYVDNEEHLYQAGQFVVTHNTELTKQLANILFPEGTNALIRLDMTEFANPDSLERFRLELTSAVSVQPYCIILLDEIEKACAPVTRILLSVLDDGRLTDRHGRSVSFLNAYIVLTTNAGNEVYKTIAQYEASDDGSGEFIARYDKLIRRSLVKTTGGSKFPPELLGRIDTIVPFQPLSEATMERIVISKLKELKRRLIDSYGVDMSVGKRVVRYLIQDSLSTDSDSGGARAVMSKLESEVTTNVASFINRFPEIREISVDVKGELASENKLKVSSDAYIVVRGVQD